MRSIWEECYLKNTKTERTEQKNIRLIVHSEETDRAVDPRWEDWVDSCIHAMPFPTAVSQVGGPHQREMTPELKQRKCSTCGQTPDNRPLP